MNNNQLNATITERPTVKLASSPVRSERVYGKSGSIVGYPPFIKTIVGAVKFHDALNVVSDGVKNE